MSAILASGYVEIARGDKVRLPMDFGDIPQLINGSGTVVSFNVSCSQVGAPAITGKQMDYPYQLSALFDATGATSGTYDIVFTITLNDTDATIVQRTGSLVVT